MEGLCGLQFLVFFVRYHTLVKPWITGQRALLVAYQRAAYHSNIGVLAPNQRKQVVNETAQKETQEAFYG